jgi:hypothetical protein
MLKTFLPANIEFWHVALLAVAIFIIFTVTVVIIKKLAQLIVAAVRFLAGLLAGASGIQKLVIILETLAIIVLVALILWQAGQHINFTGVRGLWTQFF